MKTTKYILICLGLPGLAFGRIGESPKECARRYGEPVSNKDGVTVYSKAGLNIAIWFWKGSAHQIGFSKVGKDVLGNFEPMSEAEVEALLAANGAEWKESADMRILETSWISADGKRMAAHNQTENILIIATVEYNQHTLKEKAEKEKDALEGF